MQKKYPLRFFPGSRSANGTSLSTVMCSLMIALLLGVTCAQAQTTYTINIKTPIKKKLERRQCASPSAGGAPTTFYSNSYANTVGNFNSNSFACNIPLVQEVVHSYRFQYTGIKNSSITYMAVRYWAKIPAANAISTRARIHVPFTDPFVISPIADAWDAAEITNAEASNARTIEVIQGSVLPTGSPAYRGTSIPLAFIQDRPNDDYIDISFCGVSGDFIQVHGVELEIKFQSATPPAACQTQWRYETLATGGANGASDAVAFSPNGDLFYRSGNTLSRLERTSSGWTKHNMYSIAGTSIADNVVVDPSNKVFYRTKFGSIAVVYEHQGSWLYQDFENIVGYDVAGGLTVTPDGKIFYRTTSGTINCLYFQNGNWLLGTFGHLVNNVGGNLFASPSGKIFFRTSSGYLNCLYWTGSGWAKETFPNVVPNNVGGGDLAISSTERVYYQTTSNSIDCLYWDWTNGWTHESFSHVIPANSLFNGSPYGRKGQLHINAAGQVFYVNNNNQFECMYKSGGTWHLAPMPSKTVYKNSGMAPGTVQSEMIFFGPNGIERLFFGPDAGCSVTKTGFSNENAASDDAEATGFAELMVYPNPSIGTYQVSIPEESSVTYHILDMHGRVVVQGAQLQAAFNQIDLTNEVDGVYFLHLTGDHQTKTVKLVKQTQ